MVTGTLITRKIEIDMGHRVPFHEGKCRSLHGHRYVFEAGLVGPVQGIQGKADDGMLIDYGVLKQLMVECIHDPWDHGVMLYEKDPLVEMLSGLKDQKVIVVPFIPTAECIAAHAFQLMQEKLAATDLANSVTLRYVKVNETPNTSAVAGEALN